MENRTSAEYSRAINEPLYGTIKPANLWFLLEYNGLYSNDAWGDARIPNEVKAKLESVPKSKSLLIRQPNQVNAIDRQVSLFIVNAAAENPHYFHLYLNQYEDILSLDFEAILAGRVVNAETEPVYLVCTNGKRDACCASYGVALYNALVDEAVTVWQSSHIGGHRFAGTMLCFPYALSYGYLDASDAETLVRSYRNEQVWLDKLRGHAIYPAVVQIAEYHLRQTSDVTSFDAVTYLEHQQMDNVWHVHFMLKGIPYLVSITEEEPLMVLSTTGDDTLSPVPRYQLIDVKQI